MNNTYSLELSKEEVIVLRNLIFRLNETNHLENFFVDQSEQRALRNLECVLEKNDPDVFKDNYIEILIEARNLLRDGV